MTRTPTRGYINLSSRSHYNSARIVVVCSANQRRVSLCSSNFSLVLKSLVNHEALVHRANHDTLCGE